MLYETLYSNFKDYFPWVEETVVDSEMIGPFELTIYLEDGTSAVYYDPNHTLRRLPRDSNNMSEEECRREFGFRLRSVMHSKGLDQKQLSDLTNISEVSISNYIKGKTSPSFYAVDKIAKALGCSVDEFRYR